MNEKAVAWQESDSRAFIDYGRYFVPERDLQMALFCQLIPPFSGAGHIVELCCGAGVLAQALLDRFPQATVHGYDGSPEMLAHASQQLAGYGERWQPQLFDLAATGWRDEVARLRPLRAVVSSLAIHHLDGPQKQQLFQDLHRMLAPGAPFLLADVMQPANERGQAVAAAMWDTVVRRQALALDGNLDGWAHFQQEKWNMYRYPEPPASSVDKPSTLFEHLQWLAAAGFAQVDVYWMKAGHALIGGYKAG